MKGKHNSFQGAWGAPPLRILSRNLFCVCAAVGMTLMLAVLTSLSWSPSAHSHLIVSSARSPQTAAPTMRLPFFKGDEEAVKPRKQPTAQRGMVMPVARFGFGKAAKEEIAEAKEEKEEMSIKALLSEYGLIALVFHFSVWCTSLATVYALLTLGLADSLAGVLGRLGLDGGALNGAAGLAGRATATFGIVEAIGPARLALTVAATPKVSERARQYAAVRDAEAWVQSQIETITAKLGGGSKQ